MSKRNPYPDRVVARAGDHEAVVVLQAGDAPLVPVQRPDKLAGTESRTHENIKGVTKYSTTNVCYMQDRSYTGWSIYSDSWVG